MFVPSLSLFFVHNTITYYYYYYYMLKYREHFNTFNCDVVCELILCASLHPQSYFKDLTFTVLFQGLVMW